MTETVAELSRGLWDQILAEQDRHAWIADEQAYSYADLAEFVCGMTAAMDGMGWAPDHRVLIASQDDWIAYTIWLSALLNGITPIMIAPDVGEARLRAICDAANVRAVIADESRLEGFGTTLSHVELVQVDRLAEKARGASTAPSFCLPPSDIAYVLFTYGTTSASKGVVISHDNLAAQHSTIGRVFKVDRGSRVYNGLVLYHVDGLIQGPLICTSTGATLIRPLPFLSARIEDDMAWLAEMRATHMVGAPTLFDLILNGARRDDYFDRPDFVALMSSSAKLPDRLWDELEERFSVRLINEYGMTETVAATHFAGCFPEMGGRYTIGRPIDCEARAVDSAGCQVPMGEVGELQVRGPNLLSGYLNDPDGTAEVFTDGWFRTGDLVKVAASGDYEIVGRIKTAINFGGFLIQPEEIDEAILRCPGVREAVTVGIEDAVFGQVPISAYVTDHTVELGDVMDTCREHLEARKLPRQVVQFDALPRTGSGKPDLAAVKDELFERVTDRKQQGTGLEESVLDIAASVFGVPSETLSLQSTPETTTGWDSFSHTALAIEVGASFEAPLPAAAVMEIGSLADLVAAVSKALATDERRSPKHLQAVRTGKGSGSIVVLPDLGGALSTSSTSWQVSTIPSQFTRSPSIRERWIEESDPRCATFSSSSVLISSTET